MSIENNENHVVNLEGFRGNPLLKRAGVKINWTNDLVEEYVKCKNDPIYFAENYVKIITEEGLVPIKLRDYQKEFIGYMINDRSVLAIQSRQSGKTECIRVFVLHYILFNDQKTVMILANKEAIAKEILGKIQIAYQNLPLWLQQGTNDFSKSSRIVLENGCRVIAAATSSDAIRGFTAHALVLDELDHIDNFSTFYAAVRPTISAGKNTKLIMATTPNGLRQAYKFWKDSEEGRNEIKRIFVPWNMVPGRDQAWADRELAEMGGDQAKFDQEYNCSFLGSSGTLISGQALRDLTFIHALTEVDGLSIYEQPIKAEPGGANMSHQYAIVCDVSRGKGLDYSAFSVIDITEMPYKQVCTYRNNTTPPVEYAEVIYRVGKHYNEAVALVEINDLGGQTVDHLFDLEYENVLYTESGGRNGKKISIRAGTSSERGVRTTTSVKATGCALLKLLVEQKQLIINDFETIEELSRFSRKNNSYEAESGAHDDLVMGLVLFAWLSDQNFFKELTDINTISRLRERSQEEMERDLLPFGIEFDHMPEGEASIEIGYDAFDKWMLD